MKNNATISTGVKPKFIEGAFKNNIPGVNFDGSDGLSFDGSILVNTAYTIFVVEQRASSKIENYIIAGTSTTSNESLFVGYSTDSLFTFGNYNFDVSFSISSFSQKTPAINTLMLVPSVAKKYWLNGQSYSGLFGRDLTRANLLTSFPGAQIGKWRTSTFDGDIGEIIIYSRAITTEERKAVENYLGKKYGITVSSS